ncbi:MAG: hypothetical protein PVF63_05790 [Gammaproteobacteria bacterium]
MNRATTVGKAVLVFAVIAALAAIDATGQTSPIANSVTYRIHEFHDFHSLTNHLYPSRPVFVHRRTFDTRPTEM